MRPPRRAGPPNWRRTARRRRSSSGRCGSPPEADPATVAGLYDGLGYEVSLVDRWQDAADAGERALELWRAAGDPLREGDTLRWLSRTMWRLCRGRDAVAAAEAAVAILEPLGPSTELAWAYANLASQRMLAGESDAAIELAAAAQAIAEPLGAFEVLSDALNTEGCAAADSGGEWAGPTAPGTADRDLRRPPGAGRPGFREHLQPSIAVSGDSPKLSVTSWTASPTATSTTSAPSPRSCGASGPASWRRTGRWDESVALSQEMLRAVRRIADHPALSAQQPRQDPGAPGRSQASGSVSTRR